MRTLGILLALLVPVLIFAADGERNANRPLDLPIGYSGSDDDEEDEPETIVFFGSEVEGDGFFWCFPVYGFCGETAVYEAIKAEIQSSMNQLSQRSLMAFVAYNSETYVWSYKAKKANEANKASATAWMNMLVPIESHCLLDAAITTLNISQQARGNHKQVIICGARVPYCGTESGAGYATENLTQITAHNYENSPLNTIYFESTFYSGEQQFYIDLAAMNNGTFQHVDSY